MTNPFDVSHVDRLHIALVISFRCWGKRVGTTDDSDFDSRLIVLFPYHPLRLSSYDLTSARARISMNPIPHSAKSIDVYFSLRPSTRARLLSLGSEEVIPTWNHYLTERIYRALKRLFRMNRERWTKKFDGYYPMGGSTLIQK